MKQRNSNQIAQKAKLINHVDKSTNLKAKYKVKKIEHIKIPSGRNWKIFGQSWQVTKVFQS